VSALHDTPQAYMSETSYRKRFIMQYTGLNGRYKITCKNTKRTFIGESNDIPKQWIDDIGDLLMGTHKNKLLQEDFNVYGYNSLDFEIVRTFANRKHKSDKNKKTLKTLLEELRICNPKTHIQRIGELRLILCKLKLLEFNDFSFHATDLAVDKKIFEHGDCNMNDCGFEYRQVLITDKGMSILLNELTNRFADYTDEKYMAFIDKLTVNHEANKAKMLL
jgi:hypothetical protein